jgi:hypothetical protein
MIEFRMETEASWIWNEIWYEIDATSELFTPSFRCKGVFQSFSNSIDFNWFLYYWKYTVYTTTHTQIRLWRTLQAFIVYILESHVAKWRGSVERSEAWSRVFFRSNSYVLILIYLKGLCSTVLCVESNPNPLYWLWFISLHSSKVNFWRKWEEFESIPTLSYRVPRLLLLKLPYPEKV